jgi:hypothetical protein
LRHRFGGYVALYHRRQVELSSCRHLLKTAKLGLL